MNADQLDSFDRKAAGVWVVYGWNNHDEIIRAVYPDELSALRAAVASPRGDRVMRLPWGADFAEAAIAEGRTTP